MALTQLLSAAGAAPDAPKAADLEAEVASLRDELAAAAAPDGRVAGLEAKVASLQKELAKAQKVADLSAKVAERRGEVDEDTVGALAASERDGKAKDREIHDLKEALCEAKMATAVLAAEVDGLKSGAGGLTTAADLHHSDSDPSSPAKPAAKKSWWGGKKK